MFCVLLCVLLRICVFFNIYVVIIHLLVKVLNISNLFLLYYQNNLKIICKRFKNAYLCNVSKAQRQAT